MEPDIERGRGGGKKKEKQVTETFKKRKRCIKRKNGMKERAAREIEKRCRI
jgi:hypothetical protein